ncbi:Cys-tRNA(Pro) deacylase [Oceaniserpentilla sp. 4NH20-0058]|uniref:Cys-tRNA(Pro) deacylase n=1 Tax=Oceaniserpentilla sp. 4NH20-0058 TaxID=3127660 RepID=UPI00310A844F
MTPAIKLLKKQGITHTVHEYKHNAHATSFGLEAAEKLNLSPELVFKTLIVQLDKQLAVCVVPVSHSLNLKAVAKAASSKKAAMADKQDAQKTTGYVLGGVSPLGQKKRLATFIDESALNYQTIYVSAGKRGMDVELAPQDLQNLCNATLANIKD